MNKFCLFVAFADKICYYDYMINVLKMKKIENIFLVLLLAIATVFCVTACYSNPNGEAGKGNPSDTEISYEITVDTNRVSVDTSNLSVVIYSLDGTVVEEKKLSQGKTTFELETDSYVATLSGLTDEVSYSSVLLTQNNKNATIVLENSKYNEHSGTNEFAVTVIVFAEDRNIDDLDVQICNDELCRSVEFKDGNAADRFLGVGEYEVKIYVYTDNGADELYHENYAVTLDMRFCVIRLSGQNEHTHVYGDWDEVAATCEKSGERTRVCAGCGDIQTEIIDAPGHDWSEFKTTIPAKCDAAGEKTRTCGFCKTEEKVEIPALEHEWSEYTETSPAACEKKGEKARSCELCKKVEKEEIPALRHEWAEEKIIKNPTCEDTGIRSVTCDLCGTTFSEDIIPATGHTPQSSIPVNGATCEGAGTSWNVCAVCGKGYTQAIPPIGHEYSEEFTTDITPTASMEGEESRHCTRRGCNSRTDIRALPRLVSESYFRVYVVRGENNKPSKLPLVSIRNADGAQVASGYCLADDDGRYMFERRLPFGTYTVTLSIVTEGFVHGTYTISEQDGQYPYDSPETYPTITIHLYSYLGEGPMADGSKRNTVLNDFSFTTIDGNQIKLSDLLKMKKLVWLNFYYNACGPCQSEAPTIVRVAEKYKNDVAVVCFNGKDDPESIRSGAANIFKYPETFYLVDDRGAVYGKMFGRSGYPLNVFIDSGGYVFESVSGSNYSSQFDSFIVNNIFETPERQTKSTAETFTGFTAILPDKKRYI